MRVVSRMRAAGAAAALAAVAALSPASAQDAQKVDAKYEIQFLGVNVGSLKFNSKLENAKYELKGDSKVAVALGLFKWTGDLKSNGDVKDGGMPAPVAYAYEYKNRDKEGFVKIGFEGDKAAKVELNPPKKPSKSAVPVEDAHKTGALDPLSAVMALTRFDSASPCAQKIGVFDGVRRFDLAFSPSDTKPTIDGGVVCRVKYTPVSGHKTNKDDKALSEGKIDVEFKPVPEHKLLAPLNITLSTAYGSVGLVAKSFDIEAGGKTIAVQKG